MTAMAGKLFNRTLLIRTASGAVLLVVVLGSVLLSHWTFGALMAFIGGGCLLEFYRLAAAAGAEPQRCYGTAAGVTAIAASLMSAAGYIAPAHLAAATLLFPAAFIIELYRKKADPLRNVAVTLAGIIYIALPLSMFCMMAVGNADGVASYRPWAALGCIFIVWANDVGAYLTGVSLGRHKLMERISPKKSWEGFFGGLACAAGIGALVGHLTGADALQWAGLGLVIALSGVAGDLVESMFKRAAGVKDSGAIMPGHGGFLDRFDALLLALPFAFTYFIIFKL